MPIGIITGKFEWFYSTDLGWPGRENLSRWRGLDPPGEKHWHGATPTTAMTHIAIQEQLNGKVVDWMEKVSDEQYQGDSQDNKWYD